METKRDIELQLLAKMKELLQNYQEQIEIQESQIQDIKVLHSKGMDLIDKLTATD